MSLKLMGFEVHFRFKDYEFLLHAFLIRAQEMIPSEMLFQGIVVLIVLLLSPLVSSIADMTSFMLVSTVGKEFVVAIKSLHAETTLWVSFEATLIHSPGVIISKFLMFSKFLRSEQLVLMSEDFLVSRTEITQLFVMYSLHMPMEIWPAPTSNITVGSWTIVSEE